MIHFGPWDVVLLLAVSTLGTAMAFVFDPKWKAFFLLLPVPFTLASLSLGRPVDATNVVALSVLLIFTHGVRILHTKLKAPIVVAIIVSALAYCVIGWALASVLPKSDMTFWVSAALTLALGAVLYLTGSHKEEPGYRTSLPVYIKWPAIASVVFVLVVIKHYLLGFMTLFPMLGVIAAYEGRYSLWTNCRMIPVIMLTITPMLITCRLANPSLGIGGSLALAWAVLAVILLVLLPTMWRDTEKVKAQ